LAQDNPDKLTLPVSLTPLTTLIEIGIYCPLVAKAVLTAVKSEEPIEKPELGTRRKKVWRRMTPTLAQDSPDKLTLPVSLTPLTTLIEMGIARL